MSVFIFIVFLIGCFAILLTIGSIIYLIVGLPTQQTIENELNQKRHATHIRQDQTTPDHPERNH